MVKINKVSTGAVWEDIVGYSRAIRVGNTIEISGTIAIDENGNNVGLDDPYEQTCIIIQIAEKALNRLGVGLDNVIRTRIYTTDISRWEEIGKAHGEFFGDIKPVTTMVEVSGLITPENIVEMEFSAIVT